jgi:hypothetical protein
MQQVHHVFGEAIVDIQKIHATLLRMAWILFCFVMLTVTLQS